MRPYDARHRLKMSAWVSGQGAATTSRRARKSRNRRQACPPAKPRRSAYASATASRRLEAATQARREGAIGYESQDQAERVAKAADTRLRKQAQRNVGETLSARHPYRRRSSRFVLTEARRRNYERSRERKLQGEWLEAPEWFEMMDVANALKDHRILQLRASPVVSGYGVGR